MPYKIIGYFATLLAVVRAGIIGSGVAAVAVTQQPVATVIRAENYDSHPRYSFDYGAADSLTGDSKAQEEVRNGNVFQGSYSLIEPNGARRVVSYAADRVNGFNAILQRDPGVTGKTAAAAAAHPLVVPSSAVIAAPAALRPQTAFLGAPLVRQRLVPGSTLATTNVIAANSGLLGVRLGLGSGSLYGTHTVVSDGGVVKIY